MDYEFFQSLSRSEARQYLDGFLAVERELLRGSITTAQQDGVIFDFTLASLARCLCWFVPRLSVSWVPLSADTPDWVRVAHPQGIAEFSEESKTLLLRASYYAGECFARLPGGRWDLGDPDYMMCNMPVVIGFAKDVEFPPLVVISNAFARVVANGKPLHEIDSILAVWIAKCTQNA